MVLKHYTLAWFFFWIFSCVGVPAVVQVESLQCYGSLCTLQQSGCQTDILAEFPSLLVPLAGDDQVRVCVYILSLSACCIYIWLWTNGYLVFYFLCYLIIWWMFSWFLRKSGLLKWYMFFFWNSLQSVRVASMECIVKLHALRGRIEHGISLLE